MKRRDFLKLPAVIAFAAPVAAVATEKKPYTWERAGEREESIDISCLYSVDVGLIDSIEYVLPENKTTIGFSVELSSGHEIDKDLLGPLLEASGFKRDNVYQYSPSSIKIKPVNIIYQDFKGERWLLREAVGRFDIRYYANSPGRRETRQAAVFTMSGQGSNVQGFTTLERFTRKELGRPIKN